MAYNQPYVPSTYVPSAPPQQPSAAPASAPSSGNWTCPICTSVNTTGQAACRTCGEAAPAGFGGGSASPSAPPPPVPVPVPYQQPQQQQTYQPTQQPAGYSPYAQRPQAASVPAAAAPPQQTSQPYAPVYSAPAQHRPQPQQPPTRTQTIRVPVPPGVNPGQQLRVQTGSGGGGGGGGQGADQSVLVTVPDRATWGVDPSGRPTFDVSLAPDGPPVGVVQGAYTSGVGAGARPAPTNVYGNAGAYGGGGGGYQTAASHAAPAAMYQQQQQQQQQQHHYSGKDAEWKREFDKLDKDRSGYIDRADLKKLLGGTVPNSQIDKIIGYVDKDKDGRVSFEEFKKIMKKVEMAEKVFGKTKYGKKLGLH